MKNDIENLYKLTRDDVKKACMVAGEAFQDDPVTIFTYPDEKERKNYNMDFICSIITE